MIIVNRQFTPKFVQNWLTPLEGIGNTFAVQKLVNIYLALITHLKTSFI